MSETKQKPRRVNAVLAACEEVLKAGGKPSREQYDSILDGIRSNQDPEWEAFPRTRTWFSQLR